MPSLRQLGIEVETTHGLGGALDGLWETYDAVQGVLAEPLPEDEGPP